MAVSVHSNPDAVRAIHTVMLGLICILCRRRTQNVVEVDAVQGVRVNVCLIRHYRCKVGAQLG